MISALSGGIKSLLSNPITPYIIGGLAVGYRQFIKPKLEEYGILPIINNIAEEVIPTITRLVNYTAPFISVKSELDSLLNKRPGDDATGEPLEIINRKKRKRE